MHLCLLCKIGFSIEPQSDVSSNTIFEDVEILLICKRHYTCWKHLTRTLYYMSSTQCDFSVAMFRGLTSDKNGDYLFTNTEHCHILKITGLPDSFELSQWTGMYGDCQESLSKLSSWVKKLITTAEILDISKSVSLSL